jgi:hypothetical protein
MAGPELALELPGGAIVWGLEALRELETADPPWRLDFEPDWSRAEAIRVLSGSFEDGTLLAVAAWRPHGAEGHGDDAVVGALIAADGEARVMEEVLLSVQLDASGKPSRIGLELYEIEDSIPERVAGDGARELRLRMGGVAGRGVLDVLGPA